MTASHLRHRYDRSCLNGWAFGNIGASAVSAAKFFDDLLGRHRRLLKPSTIAAMTSFGPGSVKPYANCSYGLGIWRVTELSLHPDWVNASFPGIKPYLSCKLLRPAALLHAPRPV